MGTLYELPARLRAFIPKRGPFGIVSYTQDGELVRSHSKGPVGALSDTPLLLEAYGPCQLRVYPKTGRVADSQNNRRSEEDWAAESIELLRWLGERLERGLTRRDCCSGWTEVKQLSRVDGQPLEFELPRGLLPRSEASPMLVLRRSEPGSLADLDLALLWVPCFEGGQPAWCMLKGWATSPGTQLWAREQRWPVRLTQHTACKAGEAMVLDGRLILASRRGQPESSPLDAEALRVVWLWNNELHRARWEVQPPTTRPSREWTRFDALGDGVQVSGTLACELRPPRPDAG